MWGSAGVDEADKLDREQARAVLARTLDMLGPYRRHVVGGLSLMVVWTLAVLSGPLLVLYGIDDGIVAHDYHALDMAVIAYIVVAVITFVVYRKLVVVVSFAGEGFLRDLRRRVFDHLQELSMPFYDREQAGVVISRMTSDVDSLAELVQMGLIMFLMNGLLLVLSVIVLAVVSWQLLLVCLLAVPVVVVASIRFQRESNRAYLHVRDRIGQTLSRLQEGISGVRVIQAYGRQEVEVERFADQSRGLYDAHMRSVRAQAWYLPVIEFAGLGSTALVVGLGGWMTIEGVVTIGTIAFFLLTLNNLFEPVQQLSQLFNMLQSAGAALQKLFELLDTPVDVPERRDAVELAQRGQVVVDHVSFGYGQTLVLHDVSLVIEPGERLALVGPTGAGKSTLAKLVARLYDPTEGVVRFGGVDLRQATHASLRQRIVVVPQEGFLFHGTIRDNVRVARAGATDDEVDAALADVGVLERFSALPEGLDTAVNERGTRLSAGEKQLVSLARAALVDPALLVLDEATSSLDPGTERLVEAALDRIMSGRTVVVIAHRLSTAERADRVGVVSGGRLIELGTHDDLMADEGHYRALFATWATGLAGAS
jgi:ATP-binding cassette, subfamily B, bacterial